MMTKVNRHPSRKTLAQFGATILVGFGLIGALVHHRGGTAAAMAIWSVSALVAILSWTAPTAARPLYVGWMAIGGAIGAVTSRIVMALVFFAVVTPLSLIFRAVGRDALKRRRSPGDGTYWNEHPRISEKTYYEHLY